MKKTLSILAAMAASTISAFAIDGQVLINQSTVTAAGGFPYTISEAGSYKLSGNLTASTAVAILVNTSNVTLDLNGFTITGTGAASYGVQITANFVTIRNGTIQNFVYPVYALILGPPTIIFAATLQDLVILAPNSEIIFPYLGASSRVVNVTAPTATFNFSCPSVAANSVLYTIRSSGTGCAFSGNATSF